MKRVKKKKGTLTEAASSCKGDDFKMFNRKISHNQKHVDNHLQISLSITMSTTAASQLKGIKTIKVNTKTKLHNNRYRYLCI